MLAIGAAVWLLLWSIPASGQNGPSGPEVRMTPGRGTGVKNYAPDTWGIMAVHLENRSEEPAEITAALAFDVEPTLQFARHCWLPARSRRTTWLTVRTPVEPPVGTLNLEYRMLLYHGDGSSGVVVRTPEGEMVHNSSVRASRLPTFTALIGDSREPGSRPQQEAREAIQAMRVGLNQPRTVFDFTEEFLPHSLEAFDGLDQMVIAGDRLASDPAGLVALRRWLYSGGQVWIMLDLVSPETVALLLEDVWECQVVDRVSLTTVDITRPDRRSLPSSSAGPRDYEQPVDLLRVLPSNVDVQYEVNGWPAAFWQRVGHGRVLFTTLAARGWTRPREPHETVRDPLLSSNVLGLPQFDELSFEFIQPRARQTELANVWQPMLEDQIGYETLNRGTVFGLLGGFCGALFVAGAVLSWQQRLEWLRWIAPAAALVATGVLLAAGHSHKHAVPDTVATGQFVQVAPGTSEVVLTGSAAIYHQQPSREPISATSGGILWPDMTGLAGTTRRMLWTDLGRWHWQNLELPAGVRSAPFRTAARVNQPLEASARFGPDGLRGRLTTGPFAEPSDALIATPAGMRLAVDLSEDGGFTAESGDVLAPGAFISSGLLSQEQRRRQAVYGELFASDTAHRTPERPLLFVWADPIETGFQFPDVERRAGSALLSIPLRIEPTPPGTHVRIPAPFIAYRAEPGPGEDAFTSAYSNRTGDWSQQTGHSRNWLRFQIPESLLPIDLERVRLTLQITGPAGRIEIIGVANGEPITLETRNDPVGTMHFDIERPDVLTTDAKGGLLLGVLVGVGRNDAAIAAAWDRRVEVVDPWQISFLRLEAEGQTQP